jgi:serine/threonine-protein kinase
MVTDFGIARAMSEGSSRLTATGIAIGTPTYMSPEQAAGDREIDGRSDLYALGVLGYQMLTGQPPFTASSTPAILVKHLSERPTPVDQRRTDVPPDLARVVMVLLEKDPDARFPSARALVQALDEDRPVAMPRSSVPGTLPVGERLSYGSLGQPRASHPPETVDIDSFGDRGSFTGAQQIPLTMEEQQRWDAPAVRSFRRRLAPYIYVNAVIILATMFTHTDFTFVTMIWTIFMAWKYAKLWSNGYDWRDVFRQPRERAIIDVVEDSVGYLRSLFNRDERRRLRQERHALARAARASGKIPALPPLSPAPPLLQEPDAIRRASSDRDEILRILAGMSADDRVRVPDVARSARTLAQRVSELARTLADLDRGTSPASVEMLEAEITKLEGDANPLDAVGSETRVKRLAFLKRQRRGLSEVVQKRRLVAEKLDTCLSALESMKLDLLRLTAGAETHQHITSLALDALSLADSVDNALAAADEVDRLTSRRPVPRPI